MRQEIETDARISPISGGEERLDTMKRVLLQISLLVFLSSASGIGHISLQKTFSLQNGPSPQRPHFLPVEYALSQPAQVSTRTQSMLSPPFKKIWTFAAKDQSESYLVAGKTLYFATF